MCRSPQTRKSIFQAPEEVLATRIYIWSHYPCTTHPYHVYEDCHGLANAKSLVKHADLFKFCAMKFRAVDFPVSEKKTKKDKSE